MQPYLVEVSYTAESWAKQISHPSDRFAAIRDIVAKAGGELVAGYYAFGPTDLYMIVHMPDNVSSSALSLAVSAGGALTKCQITVLLSQEDGQAAIARAGTLAAGYKPPA